MAGSRLRGHDACHGAAVALILWLAFTGFLAACVQLSASFGVAYDPLTGIIALLLWTQRTSVSVFFGFAVAAQLEVRQTGIGAGARRLSPAEVRKTRR